MKASNMNHGQNDQEPSTPINPEKFMPYDKSLPLFVYGALKPGHPAFELLNTHVNSYLPDSAHGTLYVRDGLPMIELDDKRQVQGYRLHWKSGQELAGYHAVREFEPDKQYRWAETNLLSGRRCNILVMRYSKAKGNPMQWASGNWTISDDPAFGPGLETVRKVLEESNFGGPAGTASELERFFRSQMAYLLLWSILERLSAFCFGPGSDPMIRIKRLHELPGITELVHRHVKREDYVSDSRDPGDRIMLNASNPKKCFDYYYQIRSNLSHRGKGMFKDFDKVHSSSSELLAITTDFLAGLEGKIESATKEGA